MDLASVGSNGNSGAIGSDCPQEVKALPREAQRAEPFRGSSGRNRERVRAFALNAGGDARAPSNYLTIPAESSSR